MVRKTPCGVRNPKSPVRERSGSSQLALCFHAVPSTSEYPQQPRPDGIETQEAAWYAPAALANLAMHPAMRMRVHDAVTAPDRAHFE